MEKWDRFADIMREMMEISLHIDSVETMLKYNKVYGPDFSIGMNDINDEIFQWEKKLNMDTSETMRYAKFVLKLLRQRHDAIYENLRHPRVTPYQRGIIPSFGKTY